MNFNSVHIIGAGKLGKTLGFLLHNLNLPIGHVFCKNPSNTEKAIQFIGAGTKTNLPLAKNFPQKHSKPALICIATPDQVIPSIVEELQALQLNSCLILHFSGNLPSTILSPLKKCGGLIGSIHPIKSFAFPEEAIKTFSGTYCSYEGDPECLETLKELIQNLKGNPFSILTEQKTLYHAAAVVASNYLVGLTQFAVQLSQQAGISEEKSLAFLLPLMEGTLNNIKQKEKLSMALTGPIKRGDLSTIQKHLSAFTSPQTKQLYALLGEQCLPLVKEELPLQTQEALQTLFKQTLKESSNP